MSLALVAVIAVALAFDFVNGFHDAANSIATVVSTRVLSPRLAVAWAAFFNFIAAFSGTIGIFLTRWMGFAWLDKFFGGPGTPVAQSTAPGGNHRRGLDSPFGRPPPGG